MPEPIVVKETQFPGLWSVKLDQSVDYRGSYMTFFSDDVLLQYTGQTMREGNLVDNHQYTFRGYHYSPHSWKFYLCLRGILHYYIVNWDENHPDYGKWIQMTLQPYQGFIKHPRYATGMWSITDSTLLVLQSQVYNPENPDQVTIAKGDLNKKLVELNKKPIYYPELPIVLSERDSSGRRV